MRRIARRLAVLLAVTLLVGCTPETSTPPTQPAEPDVILKPGSAKVDAGKAPKKGKKLLGPTATPKASSVKPNPNL
jgi:hypothetical protein